MSTDARGARDYVADDGFHEIQLSGKQLVFLFMATTVVSIVIFLCGVLVGRGGRPEPAQLEAIGTPVSDAGAPVSPTPDATTGSEVASPSADPGADVPTAVTEADRTYFDLLTNQSQQAAAEPTPDDGPPAAPVGTTAQATPEPVAATPPPAAAPPPVPAPVPVATAAATPPAPTVRAGWTIQVSAFRDRGQAEQFAERLKAKRYDAYVAAPDASSPLFRVRVGSYTERREATPVADRLKKDKFKPWVTR